MRSVQRHPRIGVVEMVVVPIQNPSKSCIAITSDSMEVLGNLQITACFEVGSPVCKTSTPGSNPGGASKFLKDSETLVNESS